MRKAIDQATQRLDRSRRPAAIATVAIAAILVTPYCGLMFGCGCTWPWSGLVAQCNFFQPQAQIVCPWCEHTLAGFASVVLAGVSAVLIATKMRFNMVLTHRQGIVVRILIGTATFLLVAMITGWMTAVATGYPGS